jgi:hypothetical protein
VNWLIFTDLYYWIPTRTEAVRSGGLRSDVLTCKPTLWKTVLEEETIKVNQPRVNSQKKNFVQRRASSVLLM